MALQTVTGFSASTYLLADSDDLIVSSGGEIVAFNYGINVSGTSTVTNLGSISGSFTGINFAQSDIILNSYGDITGQFAIAFSFSFDGPA